MSDVICPGSVSTMTATGIVDEKTEKRRTHVEDGSPQDGDVVSKCVGDFGRWQLLVTFLLSLLNFPCTFHIYAPTFETGKAEFWCAPPDSLRSLDVDVWRNISEVKPGDACYIKALNYEHSSVDELVKQSEEVLKTLKCEKWVFDKSQFGETIVSEWNLVCDKEQWANFAEMAFLAGTLIGGLASGLISDRFGRKVTLMSSVVAQITLGLVVAVSQCYWMYVTARFVSGIVSVSVVFCGLVLAIELVGGKWVTISGVCFMLPLPFAYMVISFIAYYTKDWRRLHLIISLSAIGFPAVSWLFKESPRWLITMKNGDEALKVMEHIAKFNKKELPANADKLVKQAILDSGDREAHSVGLKDLFNTPEIRKVSLVMYISWFAIYLVYYGLVLNLNNWGDDVYIQSIISAAVEVPAIAVSIIVLLKMGRRNPLCIATVASGVFCLLCVLVEGSDSWKLVTMATLARFCIASSNVILPVFTAEKFPTEMRNLGVGSSNAPSGVALLLVPYIWNMANSVSINPMVILGVISTLGGLSVLILPESSHL